ncbi:MAG: LPS export ABC transporter periplasmic protein LptC [Candidatus Competibacteraceae bacterium]
MKTPPGLTLRGVLSIAGLVTLAGLSYGLLRWVESSLREPELAESQAPTLTVEQFRAVRLSLTGLRDYVIEAPLLQQWPGQRGTQVHQPIIDWYQPDGTTREWRLQAEQGWIAPDHQLLRLDGEVVMTRSAASGKSPVTVLTRDVLIHPTEQQAETAAPARITTPGGEMNAVGMRAWFDQQRLELLSEVRGRYEALKP